MMHIADRGRAGGVLRSGPGALPRRHGRRGGRDVSRGHDMIIVWYGMLRSVTYHNMIYIYITYNIAYVYMYIIV